MSSLQPSVPISAAVVLLADAIDLFCSRDRSGMTAEEVGFDLVHLRHQSDRLEVEFSKLASEFAATDEYLASGPLSPIPRDPPHLPHGPAAPPPPAPHGPPPPAAPPPPHPPCP